MSGCKCGRQTVRAAGVQGREPALTRGKRGSGLAGDEAGRHAAFLGRPEGARASRGEGHEPRCGGRNANDVFKGQ